MSVPNESGGSYILATGDQAAARLLLLERIFGTSTRSLLQAAGIMRGMKIAEIGCGSGLMTAWLAETVGPKGAVTAVDASDDQLRLAERNLQSSGLLNVSLHQAHAYQTGLPRESFDLLYSRFLMCHLSEPLKALLEMRALLKPGGILVCEDHDDGGIFTVPQIHAYQRLVEISGALNQSKGLDSAIGLKLPSLLRACGFAGTNVWVQQHAFLRGEERRFWELTLREAAPAVFAAGVATPEELESICAEMRSIAEDESVLLLLARVTQVWVSK
jgi:SAM-dependent methyltransferase